MVYPCPILPFNHLFKAALAELALVFKPSLYRGKANLLSSGSANIFSAAHLDEPTKGITHKFVIFFHHCFPIIKAFCDSDFTFHYNCHFEFSFI